MIDLRFRFRHVKRNFSSCFWSNAVLAFDQKHEARGVQID